jgi:hypothetical protein
MENGPLPCHDPLGILKKKSRVGDRVRHTGAQVDLLSARRAFEALERALLIVKGHARTAMRAIDVLRQQFCEKSRHGDLFVPREKQELYSAKEES